VQSHNRQTFLKADKASNIRQPKACMDFHTLQSRIEPVFPNPQIHIDAWKTSNFRHIKTRQESM